MSFVRFYLFSVLDDMTLILVKFKSWNFHGIFQENGGISIRFGLIFEPNQTPVEKTWENIKCHIFHRAGRHHYSKLHEERRKQKHIPSKYVSIFSLGTLSSLFAHLITFYDSSGFILYKNTAKIQQPNENKNNKEWLETIKKIQNTQTYPVKNVTYQDYHGNSMSFLVTTRLGSGLVQIHTKFHDHSMSFIQASCVYHAGAWHGFWTSSSHGLSMVFAKEMAEFPPDLDQTAVKKAWENPFTFFTG